MGVACNAPATLESMCSLRMKRNRYNTLRYAGRNYSRPGKYFITICTANMEEWFGTIIDGKIHLSETGQIAAKMWDEIPLHFPNADLGDFIVMPNHIHGIIIISKPICTPVVRALHATPVQSPETESLSSQGTSPKNEIMSSISPKSGSLSAIIRSYKSAVSKQAHEYDSGFSWHRNFNDIIICTSGQLYRIRNYILHNPEKWGNDKHNKYSR